MFAAIERAIGDGISASVSYTGFNVFRFSNRWRTIDEVEAALAHEVRTHRRFERRREQTGSVTEPVLDKAAEVRSCHDPW